METKGIGLSMLFFTFVFYVVILAVFPPGAIGQEALILDWPIWTILLVTGGVLGGLVGVKVLGSGLTGPSESLAFYAATTGPIFAGMSVVVWEIFTAYNVPLNGFLQVIIAAIYGMGLFFASAEQGGGSGTA